MGLLDDAIREHLELKRLRGADPGEVIRQEHEALGPVFGADEQGADAEGQEWDGDPAGELSADHQGLDQPTVAHELNPLDQLAAGEPGADETAGMPLPREPAAPVRVAGIEQETVEVDMDEMLDNEAGESDDLESGVYDDEDDEDVWWEEPEDDAPQTAS
jgi:hypothetical protein